MPDPLRRLCERISKHSEKHQTARFVPHTLRRSVVFSFKALVVCLGIFCCPIVLSAGVIDFDLNPATGLDWGGETFKLSGNEWYSSQGVRMGFGPLGSNNDLTRMVNIREGGPSGNAFGSPLGVDTLVNGDPSGGWFISSDDLIATPTETLPTFQVSFDTPQAIVGMNILDLDQGEGWQIRAYGGGFQLLDTIDLSIASPAADARSTYFEFDRSLAEIIGIQIEYTGTASSAGFAFDRLAFSTVPSIPEPGSLMLLSTLLGGMCVRRHVSRKKCLRV